MQPLVSVIVPVFNRAQLVERSLQSVSEQTYRPLELIVVDDGSTDNTLSVLHRWKKDFDGEDFQVIILSQTNKGVSAARNAGAEVASGEYLQFLDSDDLICPNKIREQVQCLENATEAACFSYCRTIQVNRHGKEIRRVGSPMRDRFADVPQHNWHISALLMRKRLWPIIGPFAVDLPCSNDWEFAARVKLTCLTGIFLPHVCSYYVIHAGPQIVKSGRMQYARSREIAIERVGDLLMAHGTSAIRGIEVAAWLLFKNGVIFLRAGDKVGALRNMRKAAAWSTWRQRVTIQIVCFFVRLMPAKIISLRQ